MSANKRLCLRSVTEKRQSFSERICDDLCEEILKFLPIEDRFRLEGVSKQFQRTIFKSQKVFYLDIEDNLDKLLKKCGILQKKCLNVNQIKIWSLGLGLPFHYQIDSSDDDDEDQPEEDNQTNGKYPYIHIIANIL